MLERSEEYVSFYRLLGTVAERGNVFKTVDSFLVHPEVYKYCQSIPERSIIVISL